MNKCPKCKWNQLDLTNTAFSASALEKDHICYKWGWTKDYKTDGRIMVDKFTCNSPDPDLRTPGSSYGGCCI